MNTDTPLIPRSLLFGNPERANPTVSPDGRRIAFLAPHNDVLNVWVAPVDDPGAAVSVTSDSERGIRTYSWTFTGHHLVYVQDKGGDENWHLYSVDLESGEEKDLTPLENVHAQIQHLSPKHPNDILVGINDRDPSFHDIYRIHIPTGDRALVVRNSGMAGFISDDDFVTRFAARMTADGGTELLRPAARADDSESPAKSAESAESEWEPYIGIGPDDALTTSFAGFDATGRRLYVLDSRGRDTSALYELDSESDETELLFESDVADADGLMVHPTGKSVQAVSCTCERKSWRVLDEAIRPDLDYLRSVCAGEIEVLSRALDDSVWTVAYLVDDGPVHYYLYRRNERTASFLFTNNDALAEQPLVPMFTATIPARDGLNLITYVTIPGGSTTGDDRTVVAKPEQPLPMVLVVHGGPWGRDTWGYNPMHQWLANRGYAVVSVNFRSSTGFGKHFINAGNKEWGRAMHNDLLDTVQWAVDGGIADPDRIAILGGSYGGYATLAALTFTPEVFACGVDIVGPSNLITLLESIPDYWRPQIELLTTRVGDHRTEEGRAFLTERSPLTYANRIVRPLLIGQGANDPRVKRAESDQIVEAMEQKDIPVTYVLYPDEGHGFARPANRISFFAVAEAFLAGCLGGKYEQIGTAFEGASIDVLSGADAVPGLTDVL